MIHIRKLNGAAHGLPIASLAHGPASEGCGPFQLAGYIAFDASTCSLCTILLSGQDEDSLLLGMQALHGCP